jgi:hypothetical protein
MTKSTLFFAATGALLALLPATPAPAAPPTKVWVSNAGVDNASCGTITAPCATFQQAHDNVAAGGEIGVLTPGDYAHAGGLVRLTITKSVSITNDGTGEASILATGVDVGIKVNAGAGDIVSLRGLVIDGLGLGQEGIEFNTGSALHIQNCVIRNFEGGGISTGIIFVPHANNQQLFVSDTIIFNNGSGASSAGIFIEPLFTTGSADVVLDRVHLENNVDGLLIDSHFATGGAGIHVIVRDSVISGNAGNGIHAVTTAGHPPAFAFVERSSIVDNNQNGILADGPGATLLLSDSTVSRNGTGISTVNSGKLFSYGTNRINNNIGPDGTPTALLTLN